MAKHIKMTSKNHWEHLKTPGYFLVFATVFAVYKYRTGEQHTIDSLVILYAFMLAYSVLVLYLHLEYYFENRGVVLTIENDDIIYSKAGVDHIISPEDIIQVVRVCSQHLSTNQRFLLPTDDYHYIKMTLSDNRVFIITSLLYPKFAHNWPVVAEDKIRVIPFVD